MNCLWELSSSILCITSVVSSVSVSHRWYHQTASSSSKRSGHNTHPWISGHLSSMKWPRYWKRLISLRSRRLKIEIDRCWSCSVLNKIVVYQWTTNIDRVNKDCHLLLLLFSSYFKTPYLQVLYKILVQRSLHSWLLLQMTLVVSLVSLQKILYYIIKQVGFPFEYV